VRQYSQKESLGLEEPPDTLLEAVCPGNAKGLEIVPWDGAVPALFLMVTGKAPGRRTMKTCTNGDVGIGRLLKTLADAETQLATSLSAFHGLQDRISQLKEQVVALETLQTQGQGGAASKSQTGKAESPDAGDAQLHVDWCDSLVSVFKNPVISSESFSPSEVCRRFREKGNLFTLFVDETAASILVHRSGKRGRTRTLTVPWSHFQTRHHFLLGLILRSFKTRQPLCYPTVARNAFRNDLAITDSLRTAIRRAKSELDSLLGGILKDVVVAQRGGDRYVIEGQIPYCWIRCSTSISRLLP
jgi:hypothetical protein